MSESEGLKEQEAEGKAVLEDILKLMGFDGKVEAFGQEDGILLHIETPDASRLIGRGGQVLDALQTIVHRAISKRRGEGVRCIVDVERYRERQKDRLMKMAFDAADEVLRNGEPVRLSPMNAAERRIIHQALKDRTDVKTFSEEVGERGEKQVVVARTDGEKKAVNSES
jgi:spoIIIJ-associated protein